MSPNQLRFLFFCIFFNQAGQGLESFASGSNHQAALGFEIQVNEKLEIDTLFRANLVKLDKKIIR